MQRRAFLRQAGLLAAIPFVPYSPWQSTTVPVFIDADTANEVDDLYAIVRALLVPDWDIKGLSSAQWNHRLSPPQTVLESQRLNEDLLRLMNRIDIPAPTGSEMIMGKPWGGTEARNSPAAQLMIATARRMPEGEKLPIISLGAVTNVASALALAPDIVSKVRCYSLGGRYFPDRKVWDKDEFNVRNDLNATNYLFDLEGLELHVMPINILMDFKFKQQETLDRLMGKGPVWDYLATRWLTNGPDTSERIFWDLALVEAIIKPSLAEEQVLNPPPENRQRTINVYTSIDTQAMIDDWWNTVEKAFATEQR